MFNLAVLENATGRHLLLTILFNNQHYGISEPEDYFGVADVGMSAWLFESWFKQLDDEFRQVVLASMVMHSCQDIYVVHEDATSDIATLEDMDAYDKWVAEREARIAFISSFDTRFFSGAQYCINIKIHYRPELNDRKYRNVMWLVLNYFWDMRGGYEFYTEGRSGGWAVPKDDIEVIAEDCLDMSSDQDLQRTQEALTEFQDEVENCVGDFVAECDNELEQRQAQREDYTECSLWLLGIQDSIITFEDDYFEEQYPKEPRKLEYKIQHRSGRVGYLFIRYTDPDEWDSFDDLDEMYADEVEAWAQTGANAIVVKDAVSLREAYQVFKDALVEELEKGAA